MNLTLYKNCILNNKYQNVFATTPNDETSKSVLEKYLDNLEKTTIDLPNAYYERNMEIVIDYAWFETNGSVILRNEIYDFNYCKITENTGVIPISFVTRYCFIKSIEIKNGCVYLELEEDIWSSFSNKIEGTQPCMLINSRMRAVGEFGSLGIAKLPVQFDGNNELRYENLANINYDECYVICQIQYYELTSGDKIGSVNVGFFVMARHNGDSTANSVPESCLTMTYVNLKETLFRLINYQATGKYIFNNIEYNYSIGDIYIVPKWFNIKSLLNSYNGQYHVDGRMLFFGIYNGAFAIDFDVSKMNILNELVSFTIPNSYKYFSFGPYTAQIKIEQNGTTIPVKLLGGASENGFCIKLNIQNQVIDITTEFNYLVPYERINSAEFQQRKISLSLKNNELDYSIFSKAVDISNDQNKIVGGVGKAIASYYQGNISGMIGGIEQGVSAIHDTAKDIGSVVKLSKDKVLVNTPMYSNAKGTFKNNSYFLNYKYGLTLCKIEPDNEFYVKDVVDNLGFNVFLFIKYADFTEFIVGNNYIPDHIHYNSLKFDGINVYGSFTNEIAEKLNLILSSGIKIWFTETLLEDDLTDWIIE